jgi:hypothetical protein
MTAHRLFKLNYGFPVADFLVGLVVASLSFELYKLFLDERLAMPLCALTGTGAFLAWLWLKRLLPRHFIPDVVDWLLQPDVYRVTRDDLTPPLVIRLEKETHDRT